MTLVFVDSQAFVLHLGMFSLHEVGCLQDLFTAVSCDQFPVLPQSIIVTLCLVGHNLASRVHQPLYRKFCQKIIIS